MDSTHRFVPKLDLSFERFVDVPKEPIWRAWTQPQHLKPWFCPLPWTTIDCEIDLRPGGLFRTVMRSPEGQEFPNIGCYLEVVENERLVWTNALLPGFRPAPTPAANADEARCKKHAAMGFHEGWGKALDQLVALAKKM